MCRECAWSEPAFGSAVRGGRSTEGARQFGRAARLFRRAALFAPSAYSASASARIDTFRRSDPQEASPAGSAGRPPDRAARRGGRERPMPRGSRSRRELAATGRGIARPRRGECGKHSDPPGIWKSCQRVWYQLPHANSTITERIELTPPIRRFESHAAWRSDPGRTVRFPSISP